MQLQHAVKVSYDDGCYVLDGCTANGESMIAVSTSNQVIRCYDARTTTHLLELRDHNAPITDMVVAPRAHPSLLFSCQDNTGVMISDLRVGRAVHFLTEMVATGKKSSSLSVSEDGHCLALGTDGDLELIDTRTWQSIRSLTELHLDEITRVRFCGSSVCCSAGEDQMVNLFNVTEVNEDDMMLNIVNCEEVMTRMQYFSADMVPHTAHAFDFNSTVAEGGGAAVPLANGGVVSLVGSCENAMVIPLVEGAMERRLLRPNYETYQVDFVAWQGYLGQITGTKDDDGNAGPSQMTQFPSSMPIGTMTGAHQDVIRVALSLGGGTTLVTGAEDGLLAYWRPSNAGEPSVAAAGGDADDGSSTSSSMKQRARPAVAHHRSGKPY